VNDVGLPLVHISNINGDVLREMDQWVSVWRCHW